MPALSQLLGTNVAQTTCKQMADAVPNKTVFRKAVSGPGSGLAEPLCEITTFPAKQNQLNGELSAMSLFIHRCDSALRRAAGRVVNVGVRAPVQTPRLWTPTRPPHCGPVCERWHLCARLTARTWVAWGNTRARTLCALPAPAEP